MATCRFPNTLVRQLTSFLHVQQNNCTTSCSAVKCWKWDISQIVTKQNWASIKYAILVLNRPICQSRQFMANFWNQANVRVTVDGGTLQWDTYLSKLSEDISNSLKLPDFVTGDFDSITEDVLEKYKSKGCKIIHTPDQDHTDFTKALLVLNKYCEDSKTKLDHVIAIGQSSGRLDQILGNIQTLFLAKEKHLLGPNTNLFLMSDDAMSWLLQPGDHLIHVPEEIRTNKRVWCSLIPIGEACQSITTSGLKWDLDNAKLRFGDIISSSNKYGDSKDVKIKCSDTVLWSMKVPSLFEHRTA